MIKKGIRPAVKARRRGTSIAAAVLSVALVSPFIHAVSAPVAYAQTTTGTTAPDTTAGPNDLDTDGDGLTDDQEVNVHKTDPTNPDTDYDGLIDGDEKAKGTDPKKADTDGDGIKDGDEVSGNNGNKDWNGDGNPDPTNPTKRDSDNDGVDDKTEIEKGTNPNDPNSKPNDPDTTKAPDWDDKATTTPGKKVELPNNGGAVQDGTTVEVKGPGKAEIGERGQLVVTPSDDAKPGDTITVTVKAKDGKVVDTVTVTVVKEKGDSSNGGSSNGDLGRFILAGLAVGLPLLFLIPGGLASQIKVPGLSPFIEQISSQLGKANIELLKQLGIYKPAIAKQLAGINA